MAPSPIPAAPRFVAYSDMWAGQTVPPSAAEVKGFNVFAMCFLLTKPDGTMYSFDRAAIWEGMKPEERVAAKSQYKAAGISLIVSAFGSNQNPTTWKIDPIAMADKMADWVIKYDLDGIDVNYEDFNAIAVGTAGEWVVKFTKQLRTKLAKETYIVTYAPIAPWFRPDDFYPHKAFLGINKDVGDLIDWYNVQFYNQGNEYTTCEGLLTASSSTFPKTALFQIAESGVPLNKLVICKPATKEDAPSGGYMAPDLLATCLSDAKNKGWSAGVTVWQWPHATAAWIKEVRSKSWPVGN
ncbi:glycoside hydrolase family 18 protein [Collybiopsis luxurians FD-317 M1]|uniref:Glycoside hydrolase family 18 protein n=1 Tax=Collybiopsis luxurians FD-317 M1 TaxID=944289 RepID=A0A0D0C3P9_9AGAR|nr:glycoside hydrolase family 18 protein [Collybiopsis luxurians FD-317 M1]